MTGNIWTKDFWKSLAERAIATFVETFAALLVVYVTNGAGLEDVPWLHALSVAGLAAIFAVAKSLGVNSIGRDGPGVGGQEMVRDTTDLKK